jgi:glycosyltransferase involved in cell wall biosynthesis
MSPRFKRIAFVYGVPIGVGGLGVQAGNALRALADTGAEVHAIGPGRVAAWPVRPNIVWHRSPPSPAPLMRWSPLRRRSGITQHLADWRTGRFAARVVAGLRPDCCYAFTQVALEVLTWARCRGVPAVLESPNGHIAGFHEVYATEAARWCGTSYLGHPTRRMLARVSDEYEAASHVRVSSDWSRDSLVARGVPSSRIVSLQQPVDLEAFPMTALPPAEGPLRVCFVGSLDLRKGFLYLLRAVRRLGRSVSLELVGGTGDRCCRMLLERERAGVDVKVAPGDPRPALARSEIFALPTLEDGSPFAVAEAMSSGRAIVTTSSTGAAEWVRPGETGWIVSPASEDALKAALEQACARRADLGVMGRQARLDTERRVASADGTVASWLSQL